MSEQLMFPMGKYEARFPADRLYARNHMWLLEAAGGRYRVGLSAYAVRLLQDVYFLDWTVEPGAAVRAKQEIGEVESSKALSSIYAPSDGTLVGFNKELLKDPTAMNVDNYGAGWLFEFEPAGAQLMAAEDYLKYLEGTWDETQRHVKGQMND